MWRRPTQNHPRTDELDRAPLSQLTACEDIHRTKKFDIAMAFLKFY
jgi:hypothetical protein